MTDYSMFIPKVYFEQIPIKNLVSNQDYQRHLSAPHIRRTSENFDLYQINPVKVSRRDGINYVFNGQHTIEIVALVSGSRDTPVWCMIYDDLDYAEEADIFAKQQKYVKPLLPYEVFAANVEAGNSDELAIKDLVESYGLKIAGAKDPGCICAVGTLSNIYKNHGFHVLNRVLRLCVGAWEGDINSFSRNMLNGVMHLVVAYGDKLRDDLFKEKIGAVSIREIGRSAKERNSGTVGYAEAMLNIYNKKMKESLPWIKLRQKSKTLAPENEFMIMGGLNEEDIADAAEFENDGIEELIEDDGEGAASTDSDA